MTAKTPPTKAGRKKRVNTLPASQAQALQPPNQREQDAIEEARKRTANRTPRFAAKLDFNDEGGISKIGPHHEDFDGWLARLEDAFGSNSRDFALAQLNHILKACQNSKGDYDPSKANGLLATIDGLKPKNELEACLALQMAVTHELALQALVRAKRADHLPQYDSAGGMAVRLLRTYTAQIEALSKLRSKGDSDETANRSAPQVKFVVIDPVIHAAFGACNRDIAMGQTGPEKEIRNQPHALEERSDTNG